LSRESLDIVVYPLLYPLDPRRHLVLVGDHFLVREPDGHLPPLHNKLQYRAVFGRDVALGSQGDRLLLGRRPSPRTGVRALDSDIDPSLSNERDSGLERRLCTKLSAERIVPGADLGS